MVLQRLYTPKIIDEFFIFLRISLKQPEVINNKLNGEFITMEIKTDKTQYEWRFQYKPLSRGYELTEGYAFDCSKNGRLLKESRKKIFDRIKFDPDYINLGVYEVQHTYQLGSVV